MSEPPNSVAAAEAAPLYSQDSLVAHATNLEPHNIYTYQALGSRQIRVIELEPEDKHQTPSDQTGCAPIRCSIQSIDLDISGDYEAISYVWGSEERSKVVLCNGKRLDVTENLYYALLYLQRLPPQQRKSKYVWIDAVSINQADIQERNSQVLLMSTIYQRASQVIIWLQEERNTDGFAIASMVELDGWLQNGLAHSPPASQEISETLEVKREEQLKDLTTNFIQKHSQNWGFNGPVWHAIANFIDRPWFSRLWTIQEVVFATEAIYICGVLSIPVMTAYRVFKALYASSSFTGGNSLGRQTLIIAGHLRELLYSEHAGEVKLADLLSHTRYNMATDPRDKIFALINISTDARHNARMAPDYSLDLAAVFKNLAIFYLETKQSFDGLSLVRHSVIGESKIPEHVRLPSWVPDLSRVESIADPPHRSFFTSVFANAYNATRLSAPSVRFSDDHNTLILGGKVLDIIEEVVCKDDYLPAERQGFKEHEDFASKYRDLSIAFSRLVSHCPDPYPTSEDRNTAYLRTLVLDKEYWPENVRLRPDTKAQLLIQLTRYKTWANAVDKDLSKRIHPARLSSECQHLFSLLNARTFGLYNLYRTKKGYLGRTMVYTSPGDLVCVFMGAKVPYVIRPQPEGDGSRLLRETYFQGFMDGEALDHPELPVTDIPLV